MIKNIIFDFGNIFLDLDEKTAFSQLQKAGLNGFSKEMYNHNALYEKGLITTSAHLAYYQNLFPAITPQFFTDAWNTVLTGFPRYRYDFIRKLSGEKKYRLFLLSNNNALHTEWVENNIPFYTDFKNCFDAFYLSQEIHLRKPEKAAFELVLQENNLLPEETLFIDDSAANIAAAREMNFYTWHLNPEKQDVVNLFTVHSFLF